MADDPTTGIYPLGELHDFKVVDGDLDPRGWRVHSSDGRQLGEVTELLVDRATMRVRYLDVALSEPGVDTRHVIVPVGTARLDDAADRVVLGESAASVASLPSYERGGQLGRDHEDAAMSRYPSTTAGTPQAGGGATAADYYARQEFDTDRFYGSRASPPDPDTGDRG